MKENSRRSIHYGVNFVFAPEASLDYTSTMLFQQQLGEHNLEFDRSERAEKGLVLSRSSSEPLRVQVQIVGPQVSQLLIIAESPRRGLEHFIEEATIVTEVFRAVWPGPRQIISRDVTIRHLYESEGSHAFQYLWEKRLRQSADDLGLLGRSVLGGGLRIVMPPEKDRQSQVQVKIESYLRNSRDLFVETSFVWTERESFVEGMNPRELLTEAEDFACGEVVRFILGRGLNEEGR